VELWNNGDLTGDCFCRAGVVISSRKPRKRGKREKPSGRDDNFIQGISHRLNHAYRQAGPDSKGHGGNMEKVIVIIDCYCFIL